MVSFRSAHRVSSYLVRAKLYPLERCVGLRRCKKHRCEVCSNVTETDTFSRTVTGETFQINHELSCDDQCLVYLLICKVSNKQYVGETLDAFCLMWNNYKVSGRKFQRSESCMQKHLYEHFYSKGQNGFLWNVSINLIHKTDGFQPKKRENYWMRTLKTLALLGLDAVRCCQTFYILDTCFHTTILDWTVFVLRTLDTILTLYLFCLYITSVITVSASFGGFSINLLCEFGLCVVWAL